MAQRPTRKAGIPQTRLQDPKLQRTFDAIIERVEVIDGLRGDPLDKAVTYRDLGLSGFTVTGTGVGGGPQVIGVPPGSGGGDDNVGPAGPPTNLAAAETFLALLLTWVNSSVNLQHVEVWRSLTDNLSTAQLIGTTVAPLYLDYVGELKTFYYWARSVGTDGSYSAFNATAGTVGTTGIDPSAFEFELNISASNLDAALSARIDLIDVDALQDSLMTRVAAAEGDIVTIDSRTTSLESTATGLATSISGNTTSITANASLLATQQTSITTLLSDLGIVEGDVASNAASIVVNASDILNLTAAVGALDASGGQDWEFLTTVEGFTAGNATITHSGAGTGSVIFTPTGADPYFLSPTIGIGGGIFTQVVARVRQTIGGGTWEGSVTYTTGGHTASSSFIKTIPDPVLALNEWVTLTWDMSDLTAGGTDWESSTITGIRLDLVSDAAGQFEIDWIIIAKFSTTALSEAISALDVRVTTTEAGVSAQATQITALESSVNDNNTGVVANAAAVSALTTDVTTNASGITANTASILALESTVNGVDGVVANAAAIGVLETDVSSNNGILTAHASDLTQLLARVGGGYASMTNTLTTLNENYGTNYTTAEIQSFADVGGRTGVAARVTTAANNQDYVFRADGERIVVGPNDIVEVRFSVFHDRPTLAGSFYAGLYSYNSNISATLQPVTQILNGVPAASTNSNPYALIYKNADRANTWLDVSYYILGSNVDVTKCPQARINGSLDRSALTTWYDGFKVINGEYVHLRFLNFNGSPYGDSTTTTTFVTDLQVRRINSEADSYAAIQTEASVTASSVGDLNALYAVKVELNSGGIPYVSGFGLAADVVNGVATSAFGIRADQFFIVSPSNTADDIVPFSVGLVNGAATVGINGQLIVDGTIRASSIVADSIGAREINVTTLSALAVDAGVITAGMFRTAPSPAANRVEIELGSAFPIWFGSGVKGAAGGKFYVDTSGGVVVKGLLQAGMIDQSFFAPANDNQQFRIATQYPNNYTGGVYSGKKAHINTLQHMNFFSPTNFGTSIFSGGTYFGWLSNSIQFVGPEEGSNEEYGRLGTYSEMILIDIGCQIEISGEATGSAKMHAMFLQYQYNTEGWKDAYYIPIRQTNAAGAAALNHVSAFHSQVFVSREAAFSTLSFRLRAAAASNATTTSQVAVVSASLKASTPNFGYADAAVNDYTGLLVRIDQISQHGTWT